MLWKSRMIITITTVKITPYASVKFASDHAAGMTLNRIRSIYKIDHHIVRYKRFRESLSLKDSYNNDHIHIIIAQI